METRILEPLSAIGQLVVRDVVTVEATASLREVAVRRGVSRSLPRNPRFNRVATTRRWCA